MINKSDILKLILYTQSIDTHTNINDIRSVSIHMLFKQIENFNIAVLLSEKLNDIELLKSQISISIEEKHIPDILFNYEGFIKDALFIKCFLAVENHINQIANFYEKTKGDIKHESSVLITFNNLIKIEKCNMFSDLSNYDIELFGFFVYLRNTIHNIGYQTKSSKSVTINDNDSVINKNEIKLNLEFDQFNNIDTTSLLLLIEQIIKLVNKINSKIPIQDYIEHILVKSGFNELPS